MGRWVPFQLSDSECTRLRSSFDGLVIKRDIALNKLRITVNASRALIAVAPGSQPVHEAYKLVRNFEQRLIWALDHSRPLATGEKKVHLD